MDSPLRDMEKIIQIESKPDTNREYGGIYALTSEGRVFVTTENSPWEEVSLPNFENYILPVLKKGTAKMMGEKEEKIFTQHLQNESISERLVKRDSEELSKNGDQLKTIRLQKESEWEKKWNDGVRPCAWDEVADFITAIVSTREKEIADEVIAMIDASPLIHGLHFDSECETCNRNAVSVQIMKKRLSSKR